MLTKTGGAVHVEVCIGRARGHKLTPARPPAGVLAKTGGAVHGPSIDLYTAGALRGGLHLYPADALRPPHTRKAGGKAVICIPQVLCGRALICIPQARCGPTPAGVLAKTGGRC